MKKLAATLLIGLMVLGSFSQACDRNNYKSMLLGDTRTAYTPNKSTTSKASSTSTNQNSVSRQN